MRIILKKRIVLTAISLITMITHAQINLLGLKQIDTCCTTYYKGKQIRSFILKNQYITHRYGMNMTIYLDSVCDPKKQNQSIIKNEVEDNNWRTSIYHYKDSISILYDDKFKLPIYNGIKRFQLMLHKYDNLGLLIEYNDDLLATRVLVHKIVQGKYENESYYSDLYFNPISLEKKFEYTVPNDNYLEIEFYKNYFIKKLLYFYKDAEIEKVLKINFYEKNIPKEYGNINFKQGRIGKWYSYYKNGKLQSEGEYSGSTLKYDIESNILKNGKWTYYTEEGCISYTEVWQNGVLESSIKVKK